MSEHTLRSRYSGDIVVVFDDVTQDVDDLSVTAYVEGNDRNILLSREQVIALRDWLTAWIEADR